METYDVIVVGGGAAGLFAAYHAAKRGRKTALLEKRSRPGLKILISGGGRCNLTTTRTGKDLEAQYGAVRGRFLRHALRSFTPPDLRAFVQDRGVPLREEDLEKVFPVSGKARDVLMAFVKAAEDAGVQTHRERSMTGVESCSDESNARFVVHSSQGALACESLVLATGGLSYPKTGATGDGYPVVQQFGHTLTSCVPALAPLSVQESWVRELAGIVLHGVDLSVHEASGRKLAVRRRPILFTHKGLSGPAPMDVSGAVEEQRALGAAGCHLRFDFAPTQSIDVFERSLLDACSAQGRRQLSTLLPDLLDTEIPERVRTTLLANAGAAGQAAELTKAARKALVQHVKACTVPVTRSLGFDHAEVTRGGVVLDEVNARTMQSKCEAGLFLCGELLDIDGPIGGFNFQAAFATGRLAGLHA